MTESEILDYYNEHWNDYNKIVDMLHDIIDKHTNEIENLQNKLDAKVANDNYAQKVKELEKLLQKCQDSLDEETHTLK